MSVSVATVKHAYDLNDADVWFTVVSDGKTATAIFRMSESPETVDSLNTALNNRVGRTAEWGSSEDFLSGLFYNFPVTVEIDSDYENMESALQQAKNLVVSTDMQEYGDEDGFIERPVVEISESGDNA